MHDTVKALSRLMSKRLTLRLRIAKIHAELADVDKQIKRLADQLTEQPAPDAAVQS